MINQITFYLCLVLIVVGKITEKKLLNPITMFYSLWAIILFLSYIRLFNLLEAREEIYLLILVGLISFALGFYFYKFTKLILRNSVRTKSSLYSGKYINRVYEPNYKIIYFIAIICILFYFKDLVIVSKDLLSGKSLDYIRAMAQNSSSDLYASKSKIENAMKILCIVPFSQALQPIVAVDIIFGKKDRKLILMNAAILSLKVITDGGRSLIIYFFMSIVIAFSIKGSKVFSGKKRISKIKQNIIFALIVTILISILYKITASRSGENILRYAYYYFAMQPIMFDKWAMIVDTMDIYGYGVAATNGFWFAIFYVVKSIFSIGFPELCSNIYALIEGTGTNWQIITTMGTNANSFVSAFWILYLDGRIIGIIVGMFIYGIIISKSYLNATRQKSIKHISIYLFLYIGLFYTFVRLQFANIYYDIALIFLLTFMYKKKNIKSTEIKEVP